MENIIKKIVEKRCVVLMFIFVDLFFVVNCLISCWDFLWSFLKKDGLYKVNIYVIVSIKIYDILN